MIIPVINIKSLSISASHGDSHSLSDDLPLRRSHSTIEGQVAVLLRLSVIFSLLLLVSLKRESCGQFTDVTIKFTWFLYYEAMWVLEAFPEAVGLRQFLFQRRRKTLCGRRRRDRTETSSNREIFSSWRAGWVSRDASGWDIYSFCKNGRGSRIDVWIFGSTMANAWNTNMTVYSHNMFETYWNTVSFTAW